MYATNFLVSLYILKKAYNMWKGNEKKSISFSVDVFVVNRSLAFSSLVTFSLSTSLLSLSCSGVFFCTLWPVWHCAVCCTLLCVLCCAVCCVVCAVLCCLLCCVRCVVLSTVLCVLCCAVVLCALCCAVYCVVCVVLCCSGDGGEAKAKQAAAAAAVGALSDPSTQRLLAESSRSQA